MQAKGSFDTSKFFFTQRRERAAIWATLDFDEQAVGALLVDMMYGAEQWEGTLDVIRTRLYRNGSNPRQRQRIRKAFAELERLGLLFEREGKVYLLHSEHAQAEYKSLAPKKRPKLVLCEGVPDGASCAPTVQRVNRKRTGSAQEDDKKHELSARNDETAKSVEEKREDLKTPPPAGAPPTDAKGPRKVDERRAAWASQLAVASKRHGFVPTALLSAKQTRDVVAKATAHAEDASVPLEEAMRRMLDEAWERHQATGKDLKWCVVDWQPNAPQRRSWGRQKLEIADASPHESFGSEEEAWAKLRQRQAQIAADEARRKELRRVGT